ncbi:MAG: sporulation protein YjcZ [Bacillota bacterium]
MGFGAGFSGGGGGYGPYFDGSFILFLVLILLVFSYPTIGYPYGVDKK